MAEGSRFSIYSDNAASRTLPRVRRDSDELGRWLFERPDILGAL
jgi:hypothetical protein